MHFKTGRFLIIASKVEVMRVVCPKEEEACLNCHSHFRALRPLVKEAVVTKRFMHDAPGFDVNVILDCQHEHFTRLHKFEETINGVHVFRAVKHRKHIVYAIDDKHRMVFLRAFDNYSNYKRYLNKKQLILEEMGNI